MMYLIEKDECYLGQQPVDGEWFWASHKEDSTVFSTLERAWDTWQAIKKEDNLQGGVNFKVISDKEGLKIHERNKRNNGFWRAGKALNLHY